MRKELMASVAGLAFIGTLGFASPTSAQPATVGATWSPTSSTEPCGMVTMTSTKDISNIVYRIDGVDHRIEFEDGTVTFLLVGDISDVWVKSGNNQSGANGYGTRFERPNDGSCDGGPGPFVL